MKIEKKKLDCIKTGLEVEGNTTAMSERIKKKYSKQAISGILNNNADTFSE